MSLLTQTKEELREKRRDYFTNLMMKLYFNSQPFFDKNQFVTVLLEYMFLMPSIERSINKRIFLSRDGLNGFNRNVLSSIFDKIRQGQTLANHEKFVDLLDGMKQMKGIAGWIYLRKRIQRTLLGVQMTRII